MNKGSALELRFQGPKTTRMPRSQQSVLTVNTGSSSLKLDMFAHGEGGRIATVSVERIGLPASGVTLGGNDLPHTFRRKFKDHEQALTFALQQLQEHKLLQSIVAVGHRVVHGGSALVRPQSINARVLKVLKKLTAIDPDHMPQALSAIHTVSRLLPRIPQYACFDTAFHSTMLISAQLYALPRKFRSLGVRRYGFHGLSCESILHQLRQIAPRQAVGRVVIAHLGNGCSMTALKNGASIDTTMGFSPTGGLVMSSRCGDLDPSVVVFLARAKAMEPEQLTALFNKQSGMLGVSETSADMRDLLQRDASDPRAKQAVDLFCHQAKKFLGGLIAVLGGIDCLVFTGGIGEHSAVIRERICNGLGSFGIELSGSANRQNAAVISSPTAHVTVRVMQTDENQIIAHHVNQLIAKE